MCENGQSFASCLKNLCMAKYQHPGRGCAGRCLWDLPPDGSAFMYIVHDEIGELNPTSWLNSRRPFEEGFGGHIILYWCLDIVFRDLRVMDSTLKRPGKFYKFIVSLDIVIRDLRVMDSTLKRPGKFYKCINTKTVWIRQELFKIERETLCLALCLLYDLENIGFVYPSLSMIVIGPLLLCLDKVGAVWYMMFIDLHRWWRYFLYNGTAESK